MNSLGKLTSRFDTASEKISELEDMAVETIQSEAEREK